MDRFLMLFRRRAWRTSLRGAASFLWGKRGNRRVHGLRLLYRLRLQSMLRSRYLHRLVKSDVRIWVDGRQAFPRIAKLISRAQHTIVIQMYIWKDDRTGRQFAKLLTQAADRGVRVDITKEASGDSFEFHRDFFSTMQSALPLWKRFWTHPRIAVHHVSDLNHSKAFIVDDAILFLGGMNIGDEYWSKYHDYFVELRGKQFVTHFLSASPRASQYGNIRIILNNEKLREIRETFMQLLGDARRSIFLEQSYLSDSDVLALLTSKSREGVRVTVVIPEKADLFNSANLHSVSQLLRAGDPRNMRIFRYPGMLHGKLIFVDRRKAFIGSANAMALSLDSSGEANVLITGGASRALLTLQQTLWKDILKSRRLSRPPPLLWLSWVLSKMGL